MLKRNSLFVLVLVLAVSLTGCFGFLGSKVEKLELSAAKTEIGLLDEDKTIELTVVGKDKKDKAAVVELKDVKWTAVGGDVKVTDGKAILTVTATEAGDVTVKATFDKVDSNVVTIKVNAGETPVNYEALDAAITAAEALKADTGTGEAIGEAPEAAHTAFVTAIDAAKAVKADDAAKQPAVDAAVTALNEAKATFEAAIVAVDPKLILFEDFTDVTTDEFFSAAYKSLPGDDNAPLYVAKDSKVTIADGKATLVGSRFTIGMTGTTFDSTADGTASTIGTLDLSRPYKVTIVVSSSTPGSDPAKQGNLIVYVDNNSTKAAQSEHNESRIVNESAASGGALEKIISDENGIVVRTPDIGKDGSFIQVRSDSGATVVIDSIKIEYID